MFAKKLSMMIFYKKYKPFIILLILIVAIICIALFGVLPLRQSINKKMRDIQEFYAGRENREKQVGKLPELQGQYDAIIENEKTLDILIAEGGIVDFVKTLEQLAKEVNVAMEISSKDNGKIIEAKKPEVKTDKANNSDQSSVSEEGNIKEKMPSILDSVPFDRYLILNIKAEGRYEDIVAFLNKVETLPFGLDVIKIDIKKKDAEKDLPSVNRGNLANPFSMLGSGDTLPAQSQASVDEKNKENVEAVFDVLVYVKK
jgi:Tfp pilus assembly protein PilO